MMLTPLGGGRDDTTRLMDYFRGNSPGRAELGPGRFLTTGLNLKGLSCSIRGCDDATVIAALPGITGYVMDFTGYSYPNGACRTRTIGGFAIEGDGTPGIAKGGIRVGTVGEYYWGCSGLTWRDISIENTGGPCLDVCSSQLSNFENIILNTPVGCVANDVPYLRGEGAMNGNSFRRIGLRSMTPGNDCPRGGAARFLGTADAIHTPGNNQFSEWWFENLHPGTDATLFTLMGYLNTIRDFQYFDCTKEPGATGTSAFRVLLPEQHQENYGGNRIDSLIYGALEGGLDCGVDMAQPWNAVSGVKGKGGGNVLLRETARFTAIDLSATVQDSGPAPAVITATGQPTWLDGTVSICDRSRGFYFLGGGLAGATLELGNQRRWVPDGIYFDAEAYWTRDGLYPGPERGIKWKNYGTIIPGPRESLRFVGWLMDPITGQRRSGFIVLPLRDK